MARRKKKREEEHENNERWLVSYADFITLLFAFFVTMYSVSRVDGKKMGSAVESLQRALGSVIAVQTTQREPGVFHVNRTPSMVNITPIQGAKGRLSGEKENFEKLAQEIKKEVDSLPKAKAENTAPNPNQITFLFEKRGMVIRVSEHLFFKSGDASILPEFSPILDILGRTLEQVPNHIRIEGHTDSIPIHTPKFPSNWELSTARATNVLRYLLTHFHFSPENLSATGYAEYHPVDSNDTSEGRFQNRRVDLVILNSKEMEAEPSAGSSSPSPQEKEPI
jgi:chemotaxis protein MotB